MAVFSAENTAQVIGEVMDFCVCFKPVETPDAPYATAFNIPQRRAGHDMLDEVREWLDMPGIPAANFNPLVAGLRTNPTLVLSEFEARVTSLFRSESNIEVWVDGSLNGFAAIGVTATGIVSRGFTTGEEVHISLKTVVDEERLLAAWRKSGYQTTWRVSGDGA